MGFITDLLVESVATHLLDARVLVVIGVLSVALLGGLVARVVEAIEAWPAVGSSTG